MKYKYNEFFWNINSKYYLFSALNRIKIKMTVSTRAYWLNVWMRKECNALVYLAKSVCKWWMIGKFCNTEDVLLHCLCMHEETQRSRHGFVLPFQLSLDLSDHVCRFCNSVQPCVRGGLAHILSLRCCATCWRFKLRPNFCYKMKTVGAYQNI